MLGNFTHLLGQQVVDRLRPLAIEQRGCSWHLMQRRVAGERRDPQRWDSILCGKTLRHCLAKLHHLHAFGLGDGKDVFVDERLLSKCTADG